MILKLLARHNPSAIGKTLLYINREQSSLVEPSPEAVFHNMRLSSDATLAEIEHAFLEQEAYRTSTRADRIYSYHTILSVKGNTLTPVEMQKVVRKYLALRGDVVAYAVPHYDTENYHWHIAESSGYYRENRASSIRKSKLIELKKNLEQYIQREFPKLPSNVVHGDKTGISQQAYNIKHAGQTAKQRIQEIVLECIQKSSSRESFISNLAQHNLLHYERSENSKQITGILSPSGKKYRFRTLAIDQEQINNLTKKNDRQKEDDYLDRIAKIRKQQNQQNKDIEH